MEMKHPVLQLSKEKMPFQSSSKSSKEKHVVWVSSWRELIRGQFELESELFFLSLVWRSVVTVMELLSLRRLLSLFVDITCKSQYDWWVQHHRFKKNIILFRQHVQSCFWVYKMSNKVWKVETFLFTCYFSFEDQINQHRQLQTLKRSPECDLWSLDEDRWVNLHSCSGSSSSGACPGIPPWFPR